MVEEISKFLKDTKVSIISKKIGDEGMKAIISSNVSHIQKLHLLFNQITSLGLITISQAKWDNLTGLSLYGNHIRNNGCKYISRASLFKIKQLCLGNNEIQSQGALHLCKARWPQLQSLNLWDNKIGVNGAKWLLGIYSNKIRRISLTNSILTKDQTIILIMSHQSLKQIILDHKKIDEQSIHLFNSKKIKIKQN